MSPAVSEHVAVSFLDLAPMHRAVRAAFLREAARVVDSGAFINGPAVGSFEQAFAGYCGTEECIGVASGLDALRLALHGLGVGPGDEVIVPANTFIATWEAVSQVGATPVPVDVTEDDYNVDVAAVDAAVTPRTRALLPVHLYGQLADVRALCAIGGYWPGHRTGSPCSFPRRPPEMSTSATTSAWATAQLSGVSLVTPGSKRFRRRGRPVVPRTPTGRRRCTARGSSARPFRTAGAAVRSASEADR